MYFGEMFLWKIISNKWEMTEHFSSRRQCAQIWRNFATLAKFDNFLANNWFSVWQNFEPTLAIFYDVNGQILKINLDIWSHWLEEETRNSISHVINQLQNWCITHTAKKLFSSKTLQLTVRTNKSSVTRFGEILPLWHNVKVFVHFKKLYLVFGKFFMLLGKCSLL